MGIKVTSRTITSCGSKEDLSGPAYAPKPRIAWKTALTTGDGAMQMVRYASTMGSQFYAGRSCQSHWQLLAASEQSLVCLHTQFGHQIVVKGIAQLRVSQRILDRRLQIAELAAAIVAFSLKAIREDLLSLQ